MNIKLSSLHHLWTFTNTFLLLLFCLNTSQEDEFYEERTAQNSRRPFIEQPHHQNLSVPVGHTAFLRCVVKYLGDKTVSWIRRRDLHILTSGTHIFTSDPRVSLLRERNSWTLRIEGVGRKDESPYECQINTEPKIRLTFFLNVVGSQNDEWVLGPLEAQVDYRLHPTVAGNEASILGPTKVHIKLGGVTEITCLVSNPSPPYNVTWYHNDRLLKTETRGGGLDVLTTKGPHITISKLKIFNLKIEDVGKYSCGGTGLITTTSVVLSLDAISHHSSNAVSTFDDTSPASNFAARTSKTIFSMYIFLLHLLLKFFITFFSFT